MAMDPCDSKLRKLPVCEYSTNVLRFSNQITNQVFTELEQNRDVLFQLIQCYLNHLSPSGPTRIILNETTQNITMSPAVSLDFEAVTVNAPGIRFINQKFSIIGFSSAIVSASCDIVITVQYEGVDGNPHTQEQVTPFSTTITIPGNYPANSIAEGNFILNNLTLTEDIDPSSGLVTSVSAILAVSVDIRIVIPV